MPFGGELGLAAANPDPLPGSGKCCQRPLADVSLMLEKFSVVHFFVPQKS